MKLVFASANPGKIREANEILQGRFEVIPASEAGVTEEIPETGATIEENSLQKAQYLYERTGMDCFADDTGLEVDALDGAPGVYSARYAAVRYTATLSQSSEKQPAPASHDSEANMTQLLADLGNNNNRKARFRTVIALILKKDVCPCGCTSIKQEHLFEGVVEGEITQERSGAEGFGYDPIFRPDGYDKTFAELGADIKNQISHRARATAKLADYLMRL